MNSIIFITLALSVYNKTYQNDQKWIQYKDKFGKVYSDTTDEVKRYALFTENDKKIRDHNEMFLKNQVTYEMGHNQFSDMSQEEFSTTYLHPMQFENEINQEPILNISQPKAPNSFSYKQYCLTPRDQGNCGSCYIFAAVAQVEAQLKRKNKYNGYLSPQYVLDCAKFGTCDGGWPTDVLKYLKQYGGVKDSDYHYNARKHGCNNKPTRYDLGIRNVYEFSLKGNENQLKEYLYSYGPIVLSIQVEDSFTYYKKGIYYEKKCGSNCATLHHAVLLVGYGKSGQNDYWIIKNSWGTSWGDNGYGYMIRNRGNNCNIACYAMFSVV